MGTDRRSQWAPIALAQCRSVTNAGKATIKGAEAELTWVPAINWSLEADVGHLESSIDRLDINPLAVIPAGLRVGTPRSPSAAGTPL